MEDATVIVAEVRTETTGILAGEPITSATLRDASGREHRVRIVGGPTKSGLSRMAGFVVPIAGARVALDLRERPPSMASGTRSWVPNTPPGTWDATMLPLAFILALPPSRDLGADAAGELDVALRTWGRPACTAFRGRFAGTQPALSGDDGENGVFFHDTSWPEALVPGALAQTILHVDAAGKLRDADIHINGAEFRFSKDGAVGTQDIRGVLVHELGHALGLGHSGDARATMNISGSGLRWRSLEKDDVDGVCALYPGTGSAGCDADPCPSGFSCVAGACQRPGERADVCAPCSPDVGACEAAGDGARCVDIGAGSTAGRVCGRECARDSDCGAGFACRPTTEAGDQQCVSLTGCQNGANTCATDADCKQPAQAGVSCRAGACVGPRVDVLLDAGAPDADVGPPVLPPNDGCDCRTSGRARPSPLALALVLVGLLRRDRRRRG